MYFSIALYSGHLNLPFYFHFSTFVGESFHFQFSKDYVHLFLNPANKTKKNRGTKKF